MILYLSEVDSYTYSASMRDSDKRNYTIAIEIKNANVDTSLIRNLRERERVQCASHTVKKTNRLFSFNRCIVD